MSDMGRDRGNDRFPRADDDGVLSGQCFGIPDKVFDLIQCVDALRSIGKDGPGLHPFGPEIDKWGENQARASELKSPARHQLLRQQQHRGNGRQQISGLVRPVDPRARRRAAAL